MKAKFFLFCLLILTFESLNSVAYARVVTDTNNYGCHLNYKVDSSDGADSWAAINLNEYNKCMNNAGLRDLGEILSGPNSTKWDYTPLSQGRSSAVSQGRYELGAQILANVMTRIRSNIVLFDQVGARYEKGLKYWDKLITEGVAFSEEKSKEQTQEKKDGQREIADRLKTLPPPAPFSGLLDHQLGLPAGHGQVQGSLPLDLLYPDQPLLGNIAQNSYNKKFGAAKSLLQQNIVVEEGKQKQITNQGKRAEARKSLGYAQRFSQSKNAEASKQGKILLRHAQHIRFSERADLGDSLEGESLVERVEKFESEIEGEKFKREIIKSRESGPNLSQERKDQVLALHEKIINVSSEQFWGGALWEGEKILQIGKTLLDVALNVTPIISTGRSVYELFSGKDLVTGMELSTTDKVIAGVSVAIDIATVGVGGIVTKNAVGISAKLLGELGERIGTRVAFFSREFAETFVESAAKLGVKTPDGMKVYTKIHEVIEALPANLKVQRIREAADPSKVAVIGRSMGDSRRGLVGVNDVADHFSKKSVKVETFNDATAWDKFKDTVKEYRTKVGDDSAMLPPTEVLKTDLYKANKQWAQKLKDEGYTILDMGDLNEISEFSAFYAIEKKIFFHSGD